MSLTLGSSPKSSFHFKDIIICIYNLGDNQKKNTVFAAYSVQAAIDYSNW